MLEALSARADEWTAWYLETLDPSENGGAFPPRSLKDDRDLNSAAKYVAYGYPAERAAEMVLRQKDRIAGIVRGRRDVLALFLELYEVYGVYGSTTELDEVYPEPPQRLSVNDLPFVPEKLPVEYLSEYGKPEIPSLPRDVPRQPAEFPHGHFAPERVYQIASILGEDHDYSGALDDVFAPVKDGGARIEQPPDGVGEAAHERTLAIGRALLELHAEAGTPPDFYGQHEVFFRWAAEVIGMSISTVRAALAETGVISTEGKSGATGRGLRERVERAERYARKYRQGVEIRTDLRTSAV